MKEKTAFKQLKWRLILLCTTITCGILTIILIGVSMYSEEQWFRNKERTFEDKFMMVSDRVRSDIFISQLKLAEYEVKDKLIIHIEDNGNALLFNGAWKTPTPRNILVEQLKKRAEEDGIFADISMVFLGEQKSEIYIIHGENKQRYFGSVFISVGKERYRSLVMLQLIADGNRMWQRSLFFIFGLLGNATLFLFSWWFVNKALKPVEESRKKHNEFIAFASHELKSPLAVVRANAQAIANGAQADQFAIVIDKECKRMSGLLEDMLLLASMDARTWRIKCESVDMELLLVDVYELFFSFCNEKGIGLQPVMSKEILPTVNGDKERIKQILYILINNAVSYTISGDMIFLKAHKVKNRVIIEVEDHGKGIPDTQKEAVFERFYRGDKSRKDKEHFGLGLSVARELSGLQGGELKVIDTPGGGATFQLFLRCIDNKKME